MKRLTAFSLVFLVCVSGCHQGTPSRVGSDDWAQRYADTINNKVTGADCYQGHLYLYGAYQGPLKRIDLKTGKIVTLPTDYVGEAHGLRVCNDTIWLTDLRKHQVHKADLNGNLMMSLGEAGVEGCDRNHFNLPTDVAISPTGNIYVSDGYGNSRIVCFSSSG